MTITLYNSCVGSYAINQLKKSFSQRIKYNKSETEKKEILIMWRQVKESYKVKS